MSGINFKRILMVWLLQFPLLFFLWKDTCLLLKDNFSNTIENIDLSWDGKEESKQNEPVGEDDEGKEMMLFDYDCMMMFFSSRFFFHYEQFDLSDYSLGQDWPPEFIDFIVF